MILEQRWQSLEALSISAPEEIKLQLIKLQSLLTVESLTQALEALDPNFSVSLLSLMPSKNYYSDLPVKAEMFCRRVILKLSGQAMIYAESVCDMDAMACREYLNCGSTSLGRRLFGGTDSLERSAFSYALFSEKDLPDELRKISSFLEDIICARRSSFIIEGRSLHVTEWYLSPLLQKISPFSEGR